MADADAVTLALTRDKAKLEMLCAAQELPVLTSADLTTVLDMARVADVNGRTEEDDDYIPTHDMQMACYIGWKVKAGRVAGMWSFSADGQTINKAELLDHMERMMAQYAVSGDIAIDPGLLAGNVPAADYVIGN